MLVTVIGVGRLLELIVYTMAASLPLSTFASESLQDVGKGFLKLYAGVALQSVVIAIMFVALGIVIKVLNGLAFPMGAYIAMIAFAMGVMKSGTWAKKLTGGN
ncbi:hypothetical protein FACS189499_07440 [Clostridia bacterium]|nr:hypothetical protein FACS189499_07440 [Clostridia bacterium]